MIIIISILKQKNRSDHNNYQIQKVFKIFMNNHKNQNIIKDYLQIEQTFSCLKQIDLFKLKLTKLQEILFLKMLLEDNLNMKVMIHQI